MCHSHPKANHRNTHNARFSSTLAMYGHSPVIEPFVCGLHMLAGPLQNYFPPWPRQIESHPPVPALRQASPVLLDPAPRKLITVYDAHNVIVLIMTSFFLSSRRFFRLFTVANDHLQLVECCHVRSNTVICRASQLSMVTSTPCGTIRPGGGS
jgi:hypothetical protein